MTKEVVLRVTESVCSICCQRVTAKVIEKDNSVFLVKICPDHGKRNILLSRTPTYYKKLEQFHIPLIEKCKDVVVTELDVTFRCNMECPVCFWGDFKESLLLEEPTLEDIQNIIDNTSVFVLSGGEPTLREDLFSIFKIFKKNKKPIVLVTNGLKLVDPDYVCELKKAGIDRVNIQFDGFDIKAEEYLHGVNYLPIKIKALENLKRMKISTGLNAVVAKGINEKQVGRVLEYALHNDFVNTVCYLSLSNIGCARHLPLHTYIMPDQIIDILVEYSKGKINKYNVYIFKKLLITINAFLGQKWCHYRDAYLLVRKGKDYEPIGRFIKLQKIEPYLDIFQRLYLKNTLLARIFLLMVSPFIFFRYTESITLLKKLIEKSIAYFMRNSHYLNSSIFLYLNFYTVCDIYKVDYVCSPCKFVITYKKNGRICKNFARDISLLIGKQK